MLYVLVPFSTFYESYSGDFPPLEVWNLVKIHKSFNNSTISLFFSQRCACNDIV